jgi:hypothetical protein
LASSLSIYKKFLFFQLIQLQVQKFQRTSSTDKNCINMSKTALAVNSLSVNGTIERYVPMAIRTDKTPILNANGARPHTWQHFSMSVKCIDTAHDLDIHFILKVSGVNSRKL